MTNEPKICIIGAGVVGLATAVQIQEALPNASVLIIADKFLTETTSDGAAGIFRITGDLITGVDRHLLKKWMEDSYSFYKRIGMSSEGPEAGISTISGNHVYIDEPIEKDPIYKEVVDDYSERSPEFIKRLYPTIENSYFVSDFTTLMIECRWFQPWLMKKFRKGGGCIQQRRINDLGELSGFGYDVIVNCTGLGSLELLNDSKLVPNRGQLIRVKAPWVKRFLYVNHDCYILPGKETVVIGGVRQQKNPNAEVSKEDSENIWERACKYLPSLKKAEWQWEWVGHRPVRSPIRIEAETVKFNHITQKVVHNYGHGGNGVGLAWGTGKEATKLVMQLLMETAAHL